MQTDARDQRAKHRGNLSVEKQLSGDTCRSTLRIKHMVERELIISCFAGSSLHIFLHYYRELRVVVYLPWFFLVNRMWKKNREDFCERYGHHNQAELDRSFVEKPFGSPCVDCDNSLASNIVSLALVDGDYGKLYASFCL
jgi:hypothetical protein